MQFNAVNYLKHQFYFSDYSYSIPKIDVPKIDIDIKEIWNKFLKFVDSLLKNFANALKFTAEILSHYTKFNFTSFFKESSTEKKTEKCCEPFSFDYTNPINIQLTKLHCHSLNERGVGVYLTTNEEGVEKLRGLLRALPLVSNHCHIGFSGWHNFDIMVLRKSSYGLICDFNPDNKLFIEKTLKILKLSENRHMFANDFIKQMKEPPTISFSPNIKTETSEDTEVQGELTREGSWLADDASFQHIKQMAIDNRIAAIAANILDTERFEKVAEIYKNNSIKIDTVYLSNISDCMEIYGTKKQFVKTVKSLINSESIVINSSFNSQHLHDAKTILSSADCEFLFAK